VTTVLEFFLCLADLCPQLNGRREAVKSRITVIKSWMRGFGGRAKTANVHVMYQTKEQNRQKPPPLFPCSSKACDVHYKKGIGSLGTLVTHHALVVMKCSQQFVPPHHLVCQAVALPLEHAGRPRDRSCQTKETGEWRMHWIGGRMESSYSTVVGQCSQAALRVCVRVHVSAQWLSVAAPRSVPR
jgi:hypothetical protein